MDTSPDGPRTSLDAVDSLADLVLGYLRDHPEAEDTLSGIAEWWVLRQRLRVDLANLQRALDLLTAQGVLEHVGTGDYSRYRLAARVLH